MKKKKVAKPVKVGRDHPLCLILQEKGYSVRLSKDIVCCLFGTMKEALLNHEDVYTPIGNFKVLKETRKKQRVIGLHGPEYRFKYPYKVMFEKVEDEK